MTDYLERLKNHRLMRGYTQKQVADKIYMMASGYRAIEVGICNLKMDNAINLARVYGISLDELVGFGAYDTEGE